MPCCIGFNTIPPTQFPCYFCNTPTLTHTRATPSPMTRQQPNCCAVWSSYSCVLKTEVREAMSAASMPLLGGGGLRSFGATVDYPQIYGGDDTGGTIETDVVVESVHMQRMRSRRTLGFPTHDELRNRVAEVITSGIYTIPAWAARRRLLVDQPCQTEIAQYRDVGVINGATSSEALPDRLLDLESVLPVPQPIQFPVLTVSQMLAAEKRVSMLLRRVEQELLMIEREDAIRQQEAEIMNPYGTSKFLENDAWGQRMSKQVSNRLEARPLNCIDPASMEAMRQKHQSAALPMRKFVSKYSDSAKCVESMRRVAMPSSFPRILEAFQRTVPSASAPNDIRGGANGS